MTISWTCADAHLLFQLSALCRLWPSSTYIARKGEIFGISRKGKTSGPRPCPTFLIRKGGGDYYRELSVVYRETFSTEKQID
jgi:hypothetical protein